MNFSKTEPCDNCPFRVGTSMSLTSGRALEIAREALSPDGSSFPCHKTTVEGGKSGRNEVHCAGFLLFALANGNMNQMMRIAGRLGLFQPERFKAFDLVFKTKRQFLSHMTRLYQ
jgi:hypothetical protein